MNCGFDEKTIYSQRDTGTYGLLWRLGRLGWHLGTIRQDRREPQNKPFPHCQGSASESGGQWRSYRPHRGWMEV